MTENDPWAAADQGGQQQAASGQSQAMPEQESESQLFGGGPGDPSLFNKTHFLGTTRTGIITKAPYDKQKISYDDKLPLFWSPDGGRPITDRVDPVTKQPNRPVMDTFIELQTDYKMDTQELAATKRDPFEDTGARIFVAGGKFDLKKLREAIKAANSKGVSVKSGKDLVGKRLTVTRARQVPNAKGNDSWDLDIEITNA